MASSYRRTRRSGMTNKGAVIQGLMGMAIGGMNYKMQEWQTQRAEEAELRKAERLEAIQIAREGRQFENKRVEDERNFGQQKEVIGIEGKMRSELTEKELAARRELNREDNAARMSQIGAQGAIEDRHIGAREAAGLRTEEAKLKLQQKYKSNTDGVWGSDNNWYPTGAPLPAGITPVVGAGVSALQRSGSSTLTPLSPKAKSMLPPKPPAGWSAQSLDDDD